VSTGLSAISEARRLLAESTDLQQIADIKNKAEAVRQYLKASGESLDAQNRAAELRILAERRAGSLIGELGISAGNPQLLHDATIGLKELGISRTNSHRWQLAATVTDDEFAELVDRCRENSRELTTAAVLAIARNKKKEDVRREHAEEPLQHNGSEAMERLRDVVRLAVDWWPSDSATSLHIALRVIAEEIELTGRVK